MSGVNGHGKGAPKVPRRDAGCRRKPYKVDPDKTLALHEKGVPIVDIAHHQGVAESTIQRFLRKVGAERRAVGKFKTDRAHVLATVHAKAITVQDLALEAMRRDLVEDGIKGLLTPSQKKSYLDGATYAGGVAYDKERLERGLTTENLGVLGRLITEAHKNLAKDPRIAGPTPQDAKRPAQQEAHHTEADDDEF